MSEAKRSARSFASLFGDEWSRAAATNVDGSFGPPLLAYAERAVQGALAEHVVCTWVDPARERRNPVLPDACIDLVWDGARLLVAGPDTHAVAITSQATFVGIRFRPGAGPRFLGIRAHELRDRTIPLSELWGSSAELLAEQLADVSLPAASVREHATSAASELGRAVGHGRDRQARRWRSLSARCDQSIEASELERATIEASELERDAIEATELGRAIIEATELGRAIIKASEAGRAVVGASEPRRAAAAASELERAVVGASELRRAAAAASELERAVLGASELRRAAIGASELDRVVVVASELRRAATTASELERAVVGASELRRAAAAASELERAVLGASELRRAAIGASELDRMVVVATELRRAASTASELERAVVGASELRRAAAAASELERAVVGASEPRRAASSASELERAVVGASELRRAAAARILEQALLERQNALWPADPLVGQLVRDLGRSRTEPALVRTLARRLGVDERTLRRRCADALGYGPKALDRILRFRRAMRLIRSNVPLADAAHQAGYTDQAYLTNECRRLANATPSELAAGPFTISGNGCN